jgi:hypothetical protein
MRASHLVTGATFLWLALVHLPARAGERTANAAKRGSLTSEPSPPAEARPRTEDPARLAEARQRYAEGSQLASAQRWVEALEAYNRAWELHPSASTLYNIGYCEARLGHLLRAWTFMSRAVALRGGLDGERLALALSERERLRRRLPTLIVGGARAQELRLVGWDIVPVEGEADTFVAEPSVVGGWLLLHPGDRIYLAPGRYEIEARGTGPAISAQQLELAEGASTRFPDAAAPVSGRAPPAPGTLPAALKPHVPVSAPLSAPAARAQEESRASRHALRIAGYASVGVGGLALTTALVSMAVLWRAESRLEDACPSPSTCPPEQQGAVDRYKATATLSNVGLISGAAASALGVGLLLFSRSPTRATISVALTPTSVHFLQSF